MADVLEGSGEAEEGSGSGDSEGYQDETVSKPKQDRNAKARRKRAELNALEANKVALPLKNPNSATRKRGGKPKVLLSTPDESQCPKSPRASKASKPRKALDPQKPTRNTLVSISVANVPSVAARPSSQAMTIAERRAQTQVTARSRLESLNRQVSRRDAVSTQRATIQYAPRLGRASPAQSQGMPHCVPYTQIAHSGLIMVQERSHFDPREIQSATVSTSSHLRPDNGYPQGQHNSLIQPHDRSVFSGPQHAGDIRYHQKPEYGQFFDKESDLRLAQHTHHSASLRFTAPGYPQNHDHNTPNMSCLGVQTFHPPGASSMSSNRAVGCLTPIKFPDRPPHLWSAYNDIGQPWPEGYRETSEIRFSHQPEISQSSIWYPTDETARRHGQGVTPQHHGGFDQPSRLHSQPPGMQKGPGKSVPPQIPPPTSGPSTSRAWQHAHRNRFSGMHPGQIQVLLDAEQRMKSQSKAPPFPRATSVNSIQGESRSDAAGEGLGNEERMMPVTTPGRRRPAPIPASSPLGLHCLPQNSDDGDGLNMPSEEPSSSQEEVPELPTKRRRQASPKSSPKSRVSTTQLLRSQESS